MLFPARVPSPSFQKPFTPGPRHPTSAPAPTSPRLCPPTLSLESPGAPAPAPAAPRPGGRAPARLRPGEEPASDRGLGARLPGPRGQRGREAAPEAAQGPVGPPHAPVSPNTCPPMAPSLPGVPLSSGQTARLVGPLLTARLVGALSREGGAALTAQSVRTLPPPDGRRRPGPDEGARGSARQAGRRGCGRAPGRRRRGAGRAACAGPGRT